MSALTDPFQKEAIALIERLVPLSKAAFFIVSHDFQHKGALLHNLDPQAERDYCETYSALDPLSPERFANSQDTVVTLDSRIAPFYLRKTIYYQEFMTKHNHRYVADMFFRNNGTICAGLSLIREEKLGEFTKAELLLLKNIQPFLEFSLNSLYLPEREGQRTQYSAIYDLTEREQDVLECILRGCSNKSAAEQLTVGESTVKTHLHHIFRKTGVKTRSELVAKMTPLKKF